MSQNYSQFNPAGPLTGAEIVPLMQGGVTLRSTTAAIAQALPAKVSNFLIPAPPQAAAAGYNTLTFGPNLTLGQNWFLNNFPALGSPGTVVQNSDGSISLLSSSTGSIVTAQKVGGSLTGTAFATGYYLDFVAKFTPTPGAPVVPFPAFFGLDTGTLLGNPLQWPGQAPGFIHRTEIDFFQWPRNSPLFWAGGAVIDWFGTIQSGADLSAVQFTGTGGQYQCNSRTMANGDYITVTGAMAVYPAAGSIQGYTSGTAYKVSSTDGATTGTLVNLNGSAIVTAVGAAQPAGVRYAYGNITQPDPTVGNQIHLGPSANPFLFSNYNRYGFLVTPATATIQGTMVSFLNGVQMGYATGAVNPVWNQYNPALAPPPVFGSSAGSLIDVVTTPFIIGTHAACPMTIASLAVWQASGAGNLVQ